MKLDTGMILKNRLDGRKMILISSQLEIDCGDLHCRYFSEVTGMYEAEYFLPEEVEEFL